MVRRRQRMPLLRRRERTTLDDRLPWFGDEAVEWLHGYLKPAMNVFEWGTGGSTLFFAERAASVVAVEHDPAWHAQVQSVLRRRRVRNAQLLLREPTPMPSVPEAYRSTEERFVRHSFQSYAEAIDVYGDEFFDLVSVDGRARPGCMKHAVRHVRPGGCLLLHDSERAEYDAGKAYLAAWPARVMRGNGLHNPCPTETTIWQRPSRSHDDRH